MDTTTLRKTFLKHLDYLEALSFFAQDLNPTLQRNLEHGRANYEGLSYDRLKRLLGAIKRDIKAVRETYGAISDNDFYREQFAILRDKSSKGYGYISKLTIERVMFKKYAQVFPRWPHIKYHAFVIFDGKENATTNQIIQLDDMLWSDAKLMLAHATEIHGGEQDFRKRGKQQIKLQSYLRAATSAVFTFLESYLNGIAYDCFQLHHDDLEIIDHDLLAEWNSERKTPQFVAFSKKVFRYPVIVAKQNGLEFDTGGLPSAQRIAEDGKTLRDSVAIRPLTWTSRNWNRSKSVH
jgi:hypothetical protein